MKILLLGSNGQIGEALGSRLGVWATVMKTTRSELDLSQHFKIGDKLQHYRPDIIINAAAYTAVDKAEGDAELAYAVNSYAVKSMATWAKNNNALLIHYSTDYVFDGTKEAAYVEWDKPNPLSIYGKSKFAGEQEITRSGCQHLLFRTSWVYGVNGQNFAKTILTSAQEQKTMQIVNDITGAPTHADLIADTTAHCLQYYIGSNEERRKELLGIYHLTAQNFTTWHGFARYLIKGAADLGGNLSYCPEQILPITSGEYVKPAPRPPNSQLSCKKIERAFDIHLPDWRRHADVFLRNWIQGNPDEA